jgi:hypothetical protein
MALAIPVACSLYCQQSHQVNRECALSTEKMRGRQLGAMLGTRLILSAASGWAVINLKKGGALVAPPKYRAGRMLLRVTEPESTPNRSVVGAQKHVHKSSECEANEANKTPDLAKWSQTRGRHLGRARAATHQASLPEPAGGI